MNCYGMECTLALLLFGVVRYRDALADNMFTY